MICEAEVLSKKIKGLEKLIKEKTNELIDAKIGYCRATHPALIEGRLYSYNDRGKEIKGRLILDRNDFRSYLAHNGYKLKLEGKNGAKSNMIKPIYDCSKLVLIEE